jgi:hypothetical protein
MRHLLGEADEELVAFVVEQLGAHMGPDDFVDGLEPVSSSSISTSFICNADD